MSATAAGVAVWPLAAMVPAAPTATTAARMAASARPASFTVAFWRVWPVRFGAGAVAAQEDRRFQPGR
jgi:hypothetical protein